MTTARATGPTAGEPGSTKRVKIFPTSASAHGCAVSETVRTEGFAGLSGTTFACRPGLIWRIDALPDVVAFLIDTGPFDPSRRMTCTCAGLVELNPSLVVSGSSAGF